MSATTHIILLFYVTFLSCGVHRVLLPFLMLTSPFKQKPRGVYYRKQYEYIFIVRGEEYTPHRCPQSRCDFFILTPLGDIDPCQGDLEGCSGVYI